MSEQQTVTVRCTIPHTAPGPINGFEFKAAEDGVPTYTGPMDAGRIEDFRGIKGYEVVEAAAAPAKGAKKAAAPAAE